MALEEGIRIGYRRAYKHSEEPSEAWVMETIQNEVMNCIDMYFDFDDDYASS